MLPFYKQETVSQKQGVRECKLTGSTPTTMQSLLCVLLIALDIPVIVPPVPAPATMTSTFSVEGREDVDGVETTASIISGPVVYSCARGLFTWRMQLSKKPKRKRKGKTNVAVLVQNDAMRYFST